MEGEGYNVPASNYQFYIRQAYHLRKYIMHEYYFVLINNFLYNRYGDDIFCKIIIDSRAWLMNHLRKYIMHEYYVVLTTFYITVTVITYFARLS